MYVPYQRLLKGRLPAIAYVATVGYRSNGARCVLLSHKFDMCCCAAVVIAVSCVCVSRYIFEFLLLARKWALVLIGLVIHDPVLAVLTALSMSAILWTVLVQWKPYANTADQFSVRLAHVTIITQNLVLVLQASDVLPLRSMKAICSLWMLAFCCVIVFHAYKCVVSTLVCLSCKSCDWFTRS